jgi:hypothetical protein
VSVKRVSFPLTENAITKKTLGKLVYTVTNYVILNNGRDWAVARINKVEGRELFLGIKKVEIISLPANTAYVEDASLDVLNPSAMAKIVEEIGKETVIVKGKFEHISFVHKETSTPLIIFDVIPPKPPKLVKLAESALGTGRIRKPIKIVPRLVDLNKLARARKTRYVMFPCHTPTLKCGKNTLYLDQAPDLSKLGLNNITLIGCELSLRTFTTLYREQPTLIDICPKKIVAQQGVGEKCISRCCAIDKGYEREGNVTYVSWGATVGDVEEAILNLLNLNLE